MTSSRRVGWLRSAAGDARGVTLVELVMALALLSLALGSIYGFVLTGGRSARVTNDLLQTQAQVRAAMDNVVDEIRWAQRVTAASAASVTLLVPQSTPFSPSSPYTVTFAYDAGTQTLTRREDPDADGPSAAGAPVDLAYGLASLTFEYFDNNGISLGSSPADLDAVARVRMAVTAMRDQTIRSFAGDAALRGR
ncbi:MAG: prepilin-type N-terminal cleavage/methylation domain-containing protein [Armatimonadota bacterium]|nr:prepilin-type N-terminal cleavage/methylation domain-containing protein [Armatimonadota bacterium]